MTNSDEPTGSVAPGVSRRRFLQATGLGAAAAAAAGLSGGPAAAADSSAAQPDKGRTDLGYLLPYNPTDQVHGDLDHSWVGDHAARNGGLWNNWVAAKTEETMGYFTRNEIPFQYALADAFTICDGYHQSIMGPTSPNRMYLWTGTSSGFVTNPDDYEVDFGPDAGPGEVTTYPVRAVIVHQGRQGRHAPPGVVVAGQSGRLLRRGDHGRISRRLPPPLRGPHRLTPGISAAPGIPVSGAACRYRRKIA